MAGCGLLAHPIAAFLAGARHCLRRLLCLPENCQDFAVALCYVVGSQAAAGGCPPYVGARSQEIPYYNLPDWSWKGGGCQSRWYAGNNNNTRNNSNHFIPHKQSQRQPTGTPATHTIAHNNPQQQQQRQQAYQAVVKHLARHPEGLDNCNP